MPDSLRARLRGVLVTRYGQLRRKLEYIVGTGERASDALQETWLRLESMPGNTAVRNPDAYLLQMAVNVATDQYRREHRKLNDADIDALFDVEDELADPERIVAARSEIAALETALRQLTPRQREILLAAHIDGQLNREIAARLDISLSLVEKELRHALRHCQQYVGAPADMAARGGPRRF